MTVGFICQKFVPPYQKQKLKAGTSFWEVIPCGIWKSESLGAEHRCNKESDYDSTYLCFEGVMMTGIFIRHNGVLQGLGVYIGNGVLPELRMFRSA